MQEKTVFIWVHRGKSSNNSVVEAQLSLPLTFFSLFSSLHCPQGDFYTEELNLFNLRETLGMQSRESQKNFSPEANSILELLKLYFFFNGQTWNLPCQEFLSPLAAFFPSPKFLLPQNNWNQPLISSCASPWFGPTEPRYPQVEDTTNNSKTYIKNQHTRDEQWCEQNGKVSPSLSATLNVNGSNSSVKMQTLAGWVVVVFF